MPQKLEFARLRAKNRCRSFSALLQDSIATGEKLALWRLPCKSWSCPSCAKKKSRDLGNRAKESFKGLRLRFWTLTIKPQGDLPGAIFHINRAWNRLRGKIVRKYGKVKYFKVIEPQSRTKMPHFHILVDKFIDWNWMKGAAGSSGFGSHLWVEDVRDEHIYGYVIKYMRKSLNNDDFLEAMLDTRARRFGFSRCVLRLLSSNTFRPILLVKSVNVESIHTLLILLWHRISISSGFYPLPSSPFFSSIFIPNPDVLLLPSRT